jgi:hypothetical protein
MPSQLPGYLGMDSGRRQAGYELVAQRVEVEDPARIVDVGDACGL